MFLKHKLKNISVYNFLFNKYYYDVLYMDYYQKYCKYKNKYVIYKKMNINDNIITYNNKISLVGGMENINKYTSVYFRTYNLISWNINKLYSTPENNKQIKDYCESLENLTECNPPYDSLILTNTINDCCKFKEIGISKRSIHMFNINSLIVKDNINFKFIKDYSQISTPNSKTSLYTYLHLLTFKTPIFINTFIH
jgi:hypothetical protein